MRERRLTVVAVAMLLLAAAWTNQPAVNVAVDAKAIERIPPAAHAEVDLGALGTVVLGWTAKRLTAR